MNNLLLISIASLLWGAPAYAAKSIKFTQGKWNAYVYVDDDVSTDPKKIEFSVAVSDVDLEGMDKTPRARRVVAMWGEQSKVSGLSAIWRMPDSPTYTFDNLKFSVPEGSNSESREISFLALANQCRDQSKPECELLTIRVQGAVSIEQLQSLERSSASAVIDEQEGGGDEEK